MLLTCAITVTSSPHQRSLNQLPPWTKISGDIRLTPFYDAGVVYKKVLSYVQELNAGPVHGGALQEEGWLIILHVDVRAQY